MNVEAIQKDAEQINPNSPERLWLGAANEDGEHATWFEPDEGGTAYIRVDVVASTLESLQRENEGLRQDRDHIAAEKAGIAKNAHSNVDYWKSQYEAAEAEVKRYRVALIAAKTRMRNCRGAIESDQVIDKDVHGSLQNGIRDIETALASTGGEQR